MPISKADMVMQFQTHIGTTGIINTKYLAWKKKAIPGRNWKDGEKYLRSALNNVEDINKLTTGEAVLTAKAAIKQQDAKQKVRKEMADKLGESFENLEMVATVKNETIKLLAKSISELTSSNAELAATVKKLTSQI